ncbi:MAG: hypothetical protein IKT00_07815 [Prevotella sp.]|nr:hypothetical protein [Prevotella sp.]
MKKLLFVAIAAVGLCFASCKDKATTDQPAATDSVEAVVEDPAADLQKALEANDSSAFQKIITTVTEKFDALKNLDGDALNKAKEYIAKAQAFLKENAEKITAFVGGNSVISGLLDKVNAIPAEALAIPAAAEGAADAAVEGAKDAAEGAVEGAKGAVEGAAAAAADKVEGAVDAAKDAAGKAVDAAKEAGAKAAEKVGEAADKAVDGAKKALGL